MEIVCKMCVKDGGVVENTACIVVFCVLKMLF